MATTYVSLIHTVTHTHIPDFRSSLIRTSPRTRHFQPLLLLSISCARVYFSPFFPAYTPHLLPLIHGPSDASGKRKRGDDGIAPDPKRRPSSSSYDDDVGEKRSSVTKKKTATTPKKATRAKSSTAKSGGSSTNAKKKGSARGAPAKPVLKPLAIINGSRASGRTRKQRYPDLDLSQFVGDENDADEDEDYSEKKAVPKRKRGSKATSAKPNFSKKKPCTLSPKDNVLQQVSRSYNTVVLVDLASVVVCPYIVGMCPKHQNGE